MTIYVKLAMLGFITGILNGLFGAGGGTIIVPFMVFLLGIEDHKAHATAISIILPLTILSSLIYIKNGIVDIPLTLNVTIGSVIGGYIGALLLNKVPIKILRKLFGIIMIIASIRMWLT
ncbi:sulfite exporter TauE/SafE family protein [Thermoanaerobacterium sp. RBIITD]|uniref:sulfite exporter TauE/SafE family protein n=1 Tax=Thermoanaerobacterium sp. RBIITD TaxID=1550240 RepID=UPI000BB73F8B|nr:sulfite exporter TauE/SafE family protein [Thermoanaerobacterium sp. RBIITD]